MIHHLLLLSLSLLLAACATNAQPVGDVFVQETCPTTKPDDPETGLYGSEEGLRVFISNEGIWDKLPVYEDGVYGQKVFWKFPGYNVVEEPTPAFKLVGEQLDGNGHFVEDGPATNAGAADLLGSAILTGVNIPNAGCWQLTGHYRDSQLSFIVWVGGQ